MYTVSRLGIAIPNLETVYIKFIIERYLNGSGSCIGVAAAGEAGVRQRMNTFHVLTKQLHLSLSPLS